MTAPKHPDGVAYMVGPIPDRWLRGVSSLFCSCCDFRPSYVPERQGPRRIAVRLRDPYQGPVLPGGEELR